jgi:hypothetical protein
MVPSTTLPYGRRFSSRVRFQNLLFRKGIGLDIVLPKDLRQHDPFKVRLNFMYLVEVLDHLFTMSLGLSLDMANHHLGIASDFQVSSSHFSSYSKPC